jgi:hypothetical protein
MRSCVLQHDALRVVGIFMSISIAWSSWYCHCCRDTGAEFAFVRALRLPVVLELSYWRLNTRRTILISHAWASRMTMMRALLATMLLTGSTFAGNEAESTELRYSELAQNMRDSRTCLSESCSLNCTDVYPALLFFSTIMHLICSSFDT